MDEWRCLWWLIGGLIACVLMLWRSLLKALDDIDRIDYQLQDEIAYSAVLHDRIIDLEQAPK